MLENAAQILCQRKLQLFSPAGPLASLERDILGRLPRKIDENQFVVVIPDRFATVPRAIPISRATAIEIKIIFLNY